MGFKILPGPFSDKFTINAVTGEMHSKEPLDREALEDERGQMVVTVEVYDHGTPQLSTSVNVTITVGVSSGHKPGHAGAGRGLELGWMSREGMWDPWLWQGHHVPRLSVGAEGIVDAGRQERACVLPACGQADVHTPVPSLLWGTLFPGAATTMGFVSCRT